MQHTQITIKHKLNQLRETKLYFYTKIYRTIFYLPKYQYPNTNIFSIVNFSKTNLKSAEEIYDRGSIA